ncbi:cora-domain-containing protein [Corynespora cassiicola Philippines]|uniref:Cora-domain-containing protein n=1 Tax=Corynespora cassiicola Philippines TaxID=1448308 RepID=A0A2T2NH23_CORCC|nr:cora-domain-containing protein [Corynespora cassiicola Philippines]
MASSTSRRAGGASNTSSGASATNPGTQSYAAAVSMHPPAPSDNTHATTSTASAKKRKHRGGKKRRNRRQSFAAPADTLVPEEEDMAHETRPNLGDVAGQSHSRGSSSFYRLHGNHSNTSLESEALLDHRDQPTLPQRRRSVQVPQIFAPRSSQPFAPSPNRLAPNAYGRSKLSRQQRATDSEHDESDADDHTPLMTSSYRDIRTSDSYGGTSVRSTSGRRRGASKSSPTTSGPPLGNLFSQHHSPSNNLDGYDVNNPPSVPASPVLGPDVAFNDVMITEDLEHDHSDHSPEPDVRRNKSRDVLIDIDDDIAPIPKFTSAPTSPPAGDGLRRRMTALHPTDDVCFPQEGMSEIGAEDYMHRPEAGDPRSRRRRRRWPDISALEAWSREEKEQRTMEGLRMRKVSEPLMVEGRLRPQKRAWHREMDDAPYRFTYFNEEFDNTIHSQTISELVPPGQTFRNLFIPDPPIIEDSTDDETDDEDIHPLSRDATHEQHGNGNVRSTARLSKVSSGEQTRTSTPGPATPKPGQEKPKRYGSRPAFWLDVLSPTPEEMRTLCRAFSIHPLTSEDIMMQEQREKVELFKHYYFINYRTFEQDENNEDYLEPVNLYVVVFREGVISFHFSMTPHPANVRRRIRQLQDYLVLTPDWISYGIIDDITDAYAPLIQRIEEEVDEIDEAILRLHSIEEEQESKKQKSNSFNNPHYEKDPDGTKETQDSGRDMLRNIGECRKKVMSLYRLLGNKADVIKGFAKRCNEQWEVAPRSEIGLYLGDIQDHIVTMTGNLSHYENLLSRAHSNYLAQISIRMNERQEKTSDILGKLTVLGTIVLPMNVVTGIWGMNCLVPGQDVENLNWFWCITSGLIMFGLFCFLIAKRVYGIM